MLENRQTDNETYNQNYQLEYNMNTFNFKKFQFDQQLNLYENDFQIYNQHYQFEYNMNTFDLKKVSG